MIETKACTKCLVEKLILAFYKTMSGYIVTCCRQCRNKQNSAWEKSENGKKYKARYFSSPNGATAKVAASRKYLNSEKGRDGRRHRQKKYTVEDNE